MSEQAPTTEQAPAPEQAPQESKTFTQEDVDRIIETRLKRERDKLGDIDDLRRKASEFEKLEESNKTELQKLADQIAREKERADKAEESLTQQRFRAAVTTAAAKASFHDPEDAHHFLESSDIEFDADGKPTNLDKLLKSLAQSKPHLVKGEVPTTTNGSGDGGPRGSTANTKNPAQMFGDLVAEKLGR